jgi:hypothetical protein
MFLISHRGNTSGPRPNLENRPEYIKESLSNDFYVEVDVWVNNGKILLGHDEGIYPTDLYFLQNPRIICHAKNFTAVEYFHTMSTDIHWFYHNKDSCTLTSKGWVWAFPYNIINGSILNQPEFNQKWNPEEAISQYRWHISNYTFAGVCSDYISLLKEIYGK